MIPSVDGRKGALADLIGDYIWGYVVLCRCACRRWSPWRHNEDLGVVVVVAVEPGTGGVPARSRQTGRGGWT